MGGGARLCKLLNVYIFVVHGLVHKYAMQLLRHPAGQNNYKVRNHLSLL